MGAAPEQSCDLPHNDFRRVDVRSALSAKSFSVLAKSNNEPSDEELAECRRIVLEGKQDAIDLAGEIARARAHLEHLETELKDLQHAIHAHQEIIESPRRVNKDTLTEIFRLTCQSDTDDTTLESHHSLDVRQPLWCIGQVCSAWRVLITEEMPFLWTDVTLLVSDKYAKRRFILDHFLRRSRGRPLDVSLVFDEKYSAASDCNQILHLFEMSCDRWRSLHLEGWYDSLNEWDKNVLEGNMPLLDCFSHEIHSNANISLSHWKSFLYPIRLTKVEMIGWCSLMQDHIAWENITSLTWRHKRKYGSTHLFYTDFPYLMQRCTNLQQCTVDCAADPRLDYTASYAGVSLQHLRDLTLHTVVHDSDRELFLERDSETDRVLRILQLPSLSSLRITGIMYKVASVAEFIRRSRCQLQTLEMTTVSHKSLHSILAVVPNLSRLRVTDDTTDMSNALLSLLEMVTSGVCLSLRMLEVAFPLADAFWTCTDVVEEQLLSLFEKFGEASKIGSVTVRIGLESPMGFSASLSSGLQALINRGLLQISQL